MSRFLLNVDGVESVRESVTSDQVEAGLTNMIPRSWNVSLIDKSYFQLTNDFP